MAYSDPTLLPKLFEVFFPDYTYEDGYLQTDQTLTFIARKADGTIVLLCGADEGETGWEWAESTPLPENTRFGDENFTDAVNLNAWNGGAAAGVRRTGKGKWGLYYVNSLDFFVGPDWIGMYGPETDAQFFGTHAWGDITTIDWSSLPPEEGCPDQRHGGSDRLGDACAQRSRRNDGTAGGSRKPGFPAGQVL